MIAMLLPHLHKIPCNNDEKSAGNENKKNKNLSKLRENLPKMTQIKDTYDCHTFTPLTQNSLQR